MAGQPIEPPSSACSPDAESRFHHGLLPTGDGYVLDMRDAEWRHAGGRGAVCVVADDFEGRRREGFLDGSPGSSVASGSVG